LQLVYTQTDYSSGEKQDFDQKDIEILKILSKNARTLLIDIAKSLKMDSMSIYHRIKKLEDKKIIQGYKIDLNFRLLDRTFYSVKINLRDVSKMKEIKEYVLMIPELISTIEAIGSYDVEFDLQVESSEQYFKIIEDLENKFDFIRETIYFRVLENYKWIYMPEI